MKRNPGKWRGDGANKAPKAATAGRSVLVRGLAARTLTRLRKRAVANGRSLEGEIRHILEQEATPAAAGYLRRLAEVRRSIGRAMPDSTPLIREDRDR
ncbi:MAG: hypothetical protein GIKADHBN_00991 [Phycisphaerales bacterium]|nr:hypothetical protein [Phycisphaerales bacterium]